MDRVMRHRPSPDADPVALKEAVAVAFGTLGMARALEAPLPRRAGGLRCADVELFDLQARADR